MTSFNFLPTHTPTSTYLLSLLFLLSSFVFLCALPAKTSHVLLKPQPPLFRCLVSSTIFYHTLSKDFTDNIERVAKSLVALQDQPDSLAEVVLQNRRGLDLLTAEKGGLCLFLNEECCFYVNQSGIVRDMAQQLRERIIKRREELANSWGNWNNI